MDIWKYYDITHKNHVICNPSSLEKYKQLISMFKMKPKDKMLDIASGKAELVIQTVKTYENISATAIDVSPYHSKDGIRNIRERTPEADVNYLVMDASHFKPEQAHYFDVSVCLGASWIYGGYKGTLKAMKKLTKLGGIIVSGEPFWVKEPPKECFNDSELNYEDFSTNLNNIKTAEELGLNPIRIFVSNTDEWDTYESLQWHATENYIKENQNDPDISDLRKKIHEERNEYISWRRDYLGWAIYVFTNG